MLAGLASGLGLADGASTWTVLKNVAQFLGYTVAKDGTTTLEVCGL